MSADLKFSLIRYVPDIPKGERVNIGLVWQSGSDKGVRLRDNWEKVRSIDPKVNVDLIRSATRLILYVLESKGVLDEAVVGQFRSSVQLSPLTSIELGDQPVKQVLDVVFERLVESKGPPPQLSGDTYEQLRGIIGELRIQERVERGDIESAKKMFEGIPKDRNELESFLGVLAASKDEEDWIEAYEIMKKRDLMNARIHGLLSYRWWSIGKLELAISIGEEGLQVAESLKQGEIARKLKNNVSYYYADLGKPEHKNRALELARQAAEEHPDDPGLWDTQGYVRIVYGESKEEVLAGLELCERAWKANYPLRFFTKHVGAAYERMKSLGYA